MGVYEHIPYTNFHELNAAWILENTKTLLTRMDAAEARLTAAEARLTTAEGRLDAVEAEITAIEAEIVSIKSQITALTARMTAAETRLTAAEGNITAAVNRITALETRANAIELEINGLKTRMTAAEGDIDALEAREAIPAHTSSDSGKVLTATSSGIAWGTVAGGNLPAISAGDAGKVLTVNDAEDGVIWDEASGGQYPVYIDYTDSAHLPAPSDYISLIKNGHPAYLRMERSAGDGDIETQRDCALAQLIFWEQNNSALTGDPTFYTLQFFDASGLYAAEITAGSAVPSTITLEEDVTQDTVTISSDPLVSP